MMPKMMGFKRREEQNTHWSVDVKDLKSLARIRERGIVSSGRPMATGAAIYSVGDFERYIEAPMRNPYFAGIKLDPDRAWCPQDHDNYATPEATTLHPRTIEATTEVTPEGVIELEELVE
jgi:hypothetical protein